VYQLGARRALLDPTVASLRASGNAAVHTRATVLRLETTGRRVTRAVVAAADGARWCVRADRYVLACGAVENARLLLASGIDSGPVGRCFMEHPRDRAIVVVPASATTYRDAAFYDLHAVRGTPIVGRFALTERAVRDIGLNASVTLLPRIRPWVARALALSGPAGRTGIARRWLPAVGTGWSTHPAPALAYDGFVALVNLEQPPRAENRVTLGTRRDALGVPVPLLHWRWHAEDHARLRRLRAAVARDLAALGLGRVTVDDGAVPDPNAHHHAGTTRMHADPREGVVDADGRVHALDNLHVAGASPFPTAGFANPALTIVALALRLGEHLAGA
jgi:choline dehydrogenase-like flavoprotein